MSVKIAIPALLFSSMVPGISFELLAYAWPLLLLPAVYLLMGMLIGLLMLVIVNPPSNFRLGTVMACAFGNTTGIPVVLLSVLQQSLSRSVFADIADPLLFLSLELVTLPLLQYLVGLVLLRDREGGGGGGGGCGAHWCRRLRDGCHGYGGGFCGVGFCCGLCGPLDVEEEEEDDPDAEAALVLGNAALYESIFGAGSLASGGAMSSGGCGYAGGGYCGLASHATACGAGGVPSSAVSVGGACPLSSDPLTGNPKGGLRRTGQAVESTSYISMMSQGEDEVVPGWNEPATPPESTRDLSTLYPSPPLAPGRQAAAACCKALITLLRRTFVPQVIGIVGGAAVGLFGRQLVLPPETAPLGWLYLGIGKLGAAAVPINLILLGAALSRTPAKGQLPPLTAAGICIGRMIIMPLCGLAVARLLSTMQR